MAKSIVDAVLQAETEAQKRITQAEESAMRTVQAAKEQALADAENTQKQIRSLQEKQKQEYTAAEKSFELDTAKKAETQNQRLDAVQNAHRQKAVKAVVDALLFGR